MSVLVWALANFPYSTPAYHFYVNVVVPATVTLGLLGFGGLPAVAMAL